MGYEYDYYDNYHYDYPSYSWYDYSNARKKSRYYIAYKHNLDMLYNVSTTPNKIKEIINNLIINYDR